MTVVYNSIGDSYNRTRSADGRILGCLLRLLDLPAGSLVADIGAGTGNYSIELAKRGYLVDALEPSDRMREQRKEHPNLTWHSGFAEAIPFGSDRYRGVICTLATHHFSTLKDAFSEMHRILAPGGRMVIFTADLREVDENCWLKEYFGPQFRLACDKHPERSSFTALAESIFETRAVITPFPLPHDLKDGFFYSAWRYPERYLDDEFRKGISCFALSGEDQAVSEIKKLDADLKDGTWDRKYGQVRKQDQYNCGYYFLSIDK